MKTMHGSNALSDVELYELLKLTDVLSAKENKKEREVLPSLTFCFLLMTTNLIFFLG